MAAKFNRLFLAEKSMAGKSLAEFLAKSSAGAKVEMNHAYAVVGNDVIAWMSGHLLELVDADHYDPAYAKWRLEDLPIIPNPFVLIPKRGERSTAPQKIQTIGKLLADCTTVVGFGDPDAEGQLLQDQLLIYLGNKKPVLRLWSSALDDTSLSRALADLKPNTDYIGWFEAALSRSQSDWLYGINMTRACAIHAQNAGADFKVTVGRVQTPTLNLIVDREIDIRNFKPVTYFVPYIESVTNPSFKATWLTIKDAEGHYDDPRVDDEGRIINSEDAQTIVALCRKAGKAEVLEAKKTAGTEAAPLPFALSSLQTHCSKKFGMTAEQTLNTAQSLYLKKLTSYPRVDCDFLPESQHSDATAILAALGTAGLPAGVLNALSSARPGLKSKAWNDEKVTAHHAIIPVQLDNPKQVADLDPLEMKVYLEVVKRYILQFWPVAKFTATEVVLGCGDETSEELFSVNGKVYSDSGWRKAFDVDEEDEDESGKSKKPTKKSVELPPLEKGQIVDLINMGLDTKTTTSPKRFTEGTLIAAMKNIHKYVKNIEYKKRLKEGVGIGTEATRDSIIKVLKLRLFIDVKGQELVPTDAAMTLISALPDIMRSPDVTAMWQQFNDEVMQRRSNHSEFMKKMVPWLHSLVKDSANFFKSEQFPNGNKKAGGAVATEFKCFGQVGQSGCGGGLWYLDGKYGPYYACRNQECKKLFRHVDGQPVEKTPRPPEEPIDKTHKCPQCDAGYLRIRERKDKSGSFWSCSGYFSTGCKAIFNDLNGAPDIDRTQVRGSGGPGPSTRPPKRPGSTSRGRPSAYKSPTPAPAR